MTALSGWNISTLTGHADPGIAGIAFDLKRQRLWISEQKYGLFRLDVRTNDYEYHRFPLIEPEGYGPLAVLPDGSVLVGVANGRRIMKFDADLQQQPDAMSDTVLGICCGNGVPAVLLDQGNGLAVATLTETGFVRSATQVAHGPMANFFQGHTPVFCSGSNIVAIVAQRDIECVLLNYDGAILERRSFNLPPGSWNESLVAESPHDRRSPTGRRYLIDATFNPASRSLMMLYAPPSGNHGLVLLDWPLADTAPTVYEVSLWTTRILWVGNRLVCFGSETFSGPKKVVPISLANLPIIPIDEVPALVAALTPHNPNMLEQLFSADPEPEGDAYIVPQTIDAAEEAGEE